MTNTAQKWTFPSRFRARAFGWKSSSLACQRIKEAVSEIQVVARHDSRRAAQGAILFLERLWPALEQVDSSTGALGNATSRAVSTLIDILLKAPADPKTRAVWLDRLWEAFQADGVSYLQEVGERCGELCGSREVAGRWADSLLGTVRHCWEDRARTGAFSYFAGTEACISCLLAAGRYQELQPLPVRLQQRAVSRFGSSGLPAAPAGAWTSPSGGKPQDPSIHSIQFLMLNYPVIWQ